MKIKLFNYLKKFDLLDILKIEESYFNAFSLKKSKKLTKDVVLLNYAEHSPYSSFDIHYKLENEEVSLWFTDKNFDSLVVLPESSIFLQYFIKNNIEGIILFETSPQKLLVIKEGVLKRQFSKNTVAEYEIGLLKKEFNVEDSHVYTQDQYEQELNKAIENISVKDILDFFSFEFNYKNLIDVFVQKISIPLSILIFGLLIMEGLNYTYLQSSLEEVTKQYKIIKEKTQITRENINEIEDISEKYSSLKIEFKNNTKLISSMDAISDIIKDANASFLFLKLSENEFRMKIDTNKTSKIFTQIVNTGYFADLKIQSTVKNRRGSGEKVIIHGEVKW
ncbi:hypothetical protein JHD50_10600 [Sulfurimonas sp. MAG313]|nr:hypothetical protein [Sulfurimonas sp. MAG313]MDF1881741.1 hypothetical protein [Sulfurimonas sp. MAG313]